jgi:hypothetical protein
LYVQANTTIPLDVAAECKKLFEMAKIIDWFVVYLLYIFIYYGKARVSKLGSNKAIKTLNMGKK